MEALTEAMASLAAVEGAEHIYLLRCLLFQEPRYLLLLVQGVVLEPVMVIAPLVVLAGRRPLALFLLLAVTEGLLSRFIQILELLAVLAVAQAVAQAEPMVVTLLLEGRVGMAHHTV